ncbi:MAG: peptidase, partial [Phascolarctobacterium sp.]|nr:peptidase [Phascolarctobacterium sp.]
MLTFVVILLFLSVLLLAKCLTIVPQGYEYTVENFGRFSKTLQPGLHLIIPIVERIGQKVNMMEQVLDIPSQDVITKDNAMVRVDGVVFFEIQDPYAASYQIHDLY